MYSATHAGVIVSVGRDGKIRTAITTNQNVGFVTALLEKNINICYSQAGRSVLGETVPPVLSAVRGLPTQAVLKTEGTVILRNVSFTSTND